MTGTLSEDQIENLLKKEVVGRIGCHTSETVYIVPISYAYDGEYVYAHTYAGMKTDIMRKNPDVCFQVDSMMNMANWQSVIAWGIYEELPEGEERIKALQNLLNRPLPVQSSVTTHLGKNWPFSSSDINNIEGIVFRIKLTEKTGRFEHG